MSFSSKIWKDRIITDVHKLIVQDKQYRKYYNEYSINRHAYPVQSHAY